jgi:hypothetical protein
MGDLRAENKERDWHDRARDEKVENLQAGYDELRRRFSEQAGVHTNTAIDQRTEGGPGQDVVREKSQHKRRLPSDTAIGFGAAIVTGGVAETAFRLRDLPPEAASISVSVIGAGVVGLAWIRDRRNRKAKDSADHRPEG